VTIYLKKINEDFVHIYYLLESKAATGHPQWSVLISLFHCITRWTTAVTRTICM